MNQNKKKDMEKCCNCDIDMKSLESYTDQYLKNVRENMPQKEKNKIHIISALQMICVFGYFISLIITPGLLIFEAVKGYEIVLLIDTVFCGILVAFIFASIIKICDIIL